MEDELFDYGSFKLRKDAFIHNIKKDKNIDSYIMYNRYSNDDAELFKNAVTYIAEGIKNGNITKDLEYLSSNDNDAQFNDSLGMLSNDNKWHREALRYIHIIANALGKDARNKKATELKEEEKEYGNFEEFFVKSINPNAKNLTDQNLDMKSWLDINKGNESKALLNVFKNFKEKGNPDPKYISVLDSIIQGLEDNNIGAADKLAMNNMGISPAFYNTLSALFTAQPKDPVTPLIKDQGSNQEINQIEKPVSNQDNNPIEEEPVAENKKNNFAELLQNGDYYILGRNKNRKKFVYWNGEIVEVPMSFINDDKFDELRNILKKGYRNLYESENMEDLLELLKESINKHGLSSDSATNKIPVDDNIKKLELLLISLGYTTHDSAMRLIRNVADLKEPAYLRTTPPTGNWGLPLFVRHLQGGNIVKADGGLKLLYDPNNELYKSLYTEGVTSQGIKNADNSRRSTDLKFNTKYDDELDLNAYYKQFLLYSNPADRHNDFLNWAGKNYQNGDTIITLLNRYNEGIDNMYKYKQTEDAVKYGYNDADKFITHTSDATKNFNISYNEYYNTANKNVFGYDPNSQNIAGTATMARHPDITDEDIAMDFSTATITNEALKNLLTNNKITKTKTGHYIYTSNDLLENSLLGNSLLGNDLNKSSANANSDSSATTSGQEDVLPEKEQQVEIPQKTSLLYNNFPFSIRNYLDTIITNAELLDLNESRTVPLEDPIHSHRNVYGNLRALAEANRRNALRMAFTKSLFTSDNLHNMAAMLETYKQNNADWLLALGLDDLMSRDTSEKSLARRYEEYLKNHEIFWNNELRINLFDNELISGKSAEKRSNLLSRNNLWNEIKTYYIGDITEQKNIEKAVALNKLWKHMNASPISYLEGWNELDQKLWDRYNLGENITDPIEKLRIRLIQQLLELLYTLKLYPGNLNLDIPSMKDIRLGVSPYKPADIDVTVLGKRGIKLIPYMRKKGGNITKDMTKAIIDYLKESNKNYNKAVDRSVKGLYNSIKLQKLKSK